MMVVRIILALLSLSVFIAMAVGCTSRPGDTSGVTHEKTGVHPTFRTPSSGDIGYVRVITSSPETVSLRSRYSYVCYNANGE